MTGSAGTSPGRSDQRAATAPSPFGPRLPVNARRPARWAPDRYPCDRKYRTSLTNAGSPRRTASRSTSDFDSRRSAQTSSSAIANERVTLSFSRTSCGSQVASRSVNPRESGSRTIVGLSKSELGPSPKTGQQQSQVNPQSRPRQSRIPGLNRDRHRPTQNHHASRPRQTETDAQGDQSPPLQLPPRGHQRPRTAPAPSSEPAPRQGQDPDQPGPCSSPSAARLERASAQISDQKSTRKSTRLNPWTRPKTLPDAWHTTRQSSDATASEPSGKARCERGRTPPRGRYTAGTTSTR